MKKLYPYRISGNRGFTLIEASVAIMLFVIISMSLLASYTAMIRANVASRNRSIAREDARSVREIIMRLPFASVTTFFPGATEVLEDLDGDGNVDVYEDANGDGVLDLGEDLDGDGTLDLFNEDANGNGIVNEAIISNLEQEQIIVSYATALTADPLEIVITVSWSDLNLTKQERDSLGGNIGKYSISFQRSSL